MNHRQGLVVGVSLLVLTAVGSEADAASVGTTGASFLKLSVGARAEALGDGGVVGSDGIESLYWNPAGLARAAGPGRLLVSHQQLWQDMSATAFAVGLPGWGLGSVALGVETFGVSSWNNLPGGEGMDAGDLSILLGFARSVTTRIDLGFAARTVHSTIGDVSANGFAVDGGFKYRPSDHLVLAGAVRNLGPGISYSDAESDPLPLTGTLGGALGWRRVAVLGEVRAERGVDAFGCLGAELRIHPMLALRAGTRLGGTDRASSDFAWGAGVGLPNGFRFDYCYRDSDLGGSHQFSGMLPFGWGYPGGDGGPGSGVGGAPSNLVVVRALMVSGLDSLLAIMPMPAEGNLLLAPAETNGGGGAKETDGDPADELLEDLLTERLTRAGLAVHFGFTPGVGDSASGGGEPAARPVLEYRLVEVRVDYPSGRRRHYIGRKEVERSARVHLHLRLLDGEGGGVRWAGTAERAYRDVVPFSLVPVLQSEGSSFTRAEAEDQQWDKILEPVIASAIVGGLIYLFYSNKGSD